jgi:ligand-binding SRPBCC domain-containing protein
VKLSVRSSVSQCLELGALKGSTLVAMPTLDLATRIRAPIERCFDLARSVDFHVRTAEHTREHVVAGREQGLLELGESVTWRAKHFGVWQQLSSKITAVQRPSHFRDEMTQGAFASMLHDHFFETEGDETVMRDVFVFRAPLGILGVCAERLVLTVYMRDFLLRRAQILKAAAESDEWRTYLAR